MPLEPQRPNPIDHFSSFLKRADQVSKSPPVQNKTCVPVVCQQGQPELNLATLKHYKTGENTKESALIRPEGNMKKQIFKDSESAYRGSNPCLPANYFSMNCGQQYLLLLDCSQE
jgi:hypothetical protein